MIKFNAKNERGRTIIGLGLSEENVQRLKAGLPIHIHADELGFVGEIVIFYGETEDTIAKDLGGIIDENTDMRDTRGKKRH